MKKFFINLFLILLGIFGTIGYQEYFSCEDKVVCASDSTKVDSLNVIEPTAIDTSKNDSAK